MREDKCGRARRDFTHSIFSSISRTSEYGSTFYHMRLTVSQWCRMRCAMWPCSIRSYRTVSLAVHYCGPAACLRASSPKSPNPIRFPWARIKQPQSQGGRIVSGGPNSANVQLTSRHSVLLRLFTPTINSNVHLQRIQIAWQDRPHHWRKRRYRRGTHHSQCVLLSPRLIKVIYVQISTFRPPLYCLQRYQLAPCLSDYQRRSFDTPLVDVI